MGKSKSQNHNNASNQNNASISSRSCNMKMKRTRKSSVPGDSPSRRSSVYRGVTRHRWTGRYEAHLWDKNCRNESQNKKGRQVYLGAYDDEKAAAHAYDLAALKYWGHDTILNFPLSTYQEEFKEMEKQSREEYIGYLRRKSSGFSRGVSKYRGVARHHQNGRWEARIGQVFGNKYLYLGTYATQEEAATAYDLAAIKNRGLSAVTNFDLSRYMHCRRPNHDGLNADPSADNIANAGQSPQQSSQQSEQQGVTTREEVSQFQDHPIAGGVAATTTALGLLLQSSKFKEMLEKTSAEGISAATATAAAASICDDKPSYECSFPDYIQTYFECQDTVSMTEEEDSIFGNLNAFVSPIFEFELDI